MISTLYIAGKAIEIPASALTDVLNPANQLPFAKIFMAQEQHMRAAIEAADAAEASWAATPPFERERILHRAADGLESAKQEIVDQLIEEGGATFGKYEGNFYHPTVLADVTPEMAVFRDELFGPVAAVSKAKDADHALALANTSAYGLSSAVMTNDLQLAMRFALELESGMVHVNGPTIHDEATVPFGGVRDSGSGRKGGRWSIDEMIEVKWVTIQMGQHPYPYLTGYRRNQPDGTRLRMPKNLNSCIIPLFC
jgi:acyl-CoA reductase-like NAD-dependent aldehyde dehydrogenase